MRDRNNRNVMADMLKELQGGKMPHELNLQQNPKLLEAMKGITPEMMLEMRKFLMENKDGIHLGKPGDTKFDTKLLDTSVLSPKAREIIDIISGNSMLRQNRDGELNRGMGVLASERLLDILSPE